MSSRLGAAMLILAASGSLVGGSLGAVSKAEAAPTVPTGINKATSWMASLHDPIAIAGAHGNVWFADRGDNPDPTNPDGDDTEGTVGRITSDGYVESWHTALPPTSLTVGPDHALWYGMDHGYVGRISPTSHVRTIYNTHNDTPITAITAGRGGVWFIAGGLGVGGWTPFLGEITMKGKLKIRSSKLLVNPVGLTVANGDVWVLDSGGYDSTQNLVGMSVLRFKPGGSAKRYQNRVLADNVGSGGAITTGPDGALWIADGDIVRLTTSGSWSKYGSSQGHASSSIIAGPDHALWYVDGENRIGRITALGKVRHYHGSADSICFDSHGTLWLARGTGHGIEKVNIHSKARRLFSGEIDDPSAVVTGPDHALWFTDYGNNSIGRFVPGKGAVFFFSSKISRPTDLVVGPDNALWFTNYGNKTIGRFSPTSHKFTAYRGTGIRKPVGITVGPDHALWFTNKGNNSIGRITMQGTVTNYPGGPNTKDPTDITTGPDGALWYLSFTNNAVDRINPTTHEVTQVRSDVYDPSGIVSSLGDVWTTQEGELDRISPSGAVARRQIHGDGSDIDGVGRDAAGRVWYFSASDDSNQVAIPGGIGLRASSKKVYFRKATDEDYDPTALTIGPDRAMWFVSGSGAGSISRITAKT